MTFASPLALVDVLAVDTPFAGPMSLFSLAGLVSLVTLAALEIVLGIDNVIFIAILAGRLPEADRASARRAGIAVAVVSRIMLLLGITWVMGLTAPLFQAFGVEFTGKALILLGGGLFLIGKATSEIHEKLEGAADAPTARRSGGYPRFWSVVLQIMVIDIVFSLDSVITAVGMTNHVPVMIAAVIVAAAVMMVFATAVSDFVHRHPTIKMLALAFLLLIGVMLVAEGFGQHVDKGYIYFAMAFSLGVELLNLRMRKRVEPVELRNSELP
ncbi:MAG: TerC family protein [Vicinamibacterales bacterium]